MKLDWIAVVGGHPVGDPHPPPPPPHIPTSTQAHPHPHPHTPGPPNNHPPVAQLAEGLLGRQDAAVLILASQRHLATEEEEEGMQ